MKKINSKGTSHCGTPASEMIPSETSYRLFPYYSHRLKATLEPDFALKIATY